MPSDERPVRLSACGLPPPMPPTTSASTARESPGCRACSASSPRWRFAPSRAGRAIRSRIEYADNASHPHALGFRRTVAAGPAQPRELRAARAIASCSGAMTRSTCIVGRETCDAAEILPMTPMMRTTWPISAACSAIAAGGAWWHLVRHGCGGAGRSRILPRRLRRLRKAPALPPHGSQAPRARA